jgi:hypothetical protein
LRISTSALARCSILSSCGHLSIHPSIRPFIRLCMYQSAYASMYASMYRSIYCATRTQCACATASCRHRKSQPPHLHRDSARPAAPHLHPDSARPTATSAPGLGSPCCPTSAPGLRALRRPASAQRRWPPHLLQPRLQLEALLLLLLHLRPANGAESSRPNGSRGYRRVGIGMHGGVKETQ